MKIISCESINTGGCIICTFGQTDAKEKSFFLFSTEGECICLNDSPCFAISGYDNDSFYNWFDSCIEIADENGGAEIKTIAYDFIESNGYSLGYDEKQHREYLRELLNKLEGEKC